MNDEVNLELIVDTKDESVIQPIQDQLSELNITRGRPSRALDPITILAIAAGAVKLINELITLRQNLMKQKNAPNVTIRNEKGKSLNLSNSSDAEIEDFIVAI